MQQLLWQLTGFAFGSAAAVLGTLGWFLWTGYTPTDPVPAGYALLTLLVNLLCAGCGGALAAAVGRSRKAFLAVAALCVVLSLAAVALTRPWGGGWDSLWWLAIALTVVPTATMVAGSAVLRRRLRA